MKMIIVFIMPPTDPADVRCECGALLARKVPGGLEIRCRRCRRSVLILLSDLASGPRVLSLCAPRPEDARR